MLCRVTPAAWLVLMLAACSSLPDSAADGRAYPCRELRVHVVTHESNPLVPGGVLVEGAHGASVSIYTVVRRDSVTAGRPGFIPDEGTALFAPKSNVVSGRLDDSDGWVCFPCAPESRLVLGCFGPGYRGLFRELGDLDSARSVRIRLRPTYTRQLPAYEVSPR